MDHGTEKNLKHEMLYKVTKMYNSFIKKIYNVVYKNKIWNTSYKKPTISFYMKLVKNIVKMG